jgi:hypothetical protein
MPLSNLFADGNGWASFQKWSSFRYGETGAVRINDWRVRQME